MGMSVEDCLDVGGPTLWAVLSLGSGLVYIKMLAKHMLAHESASSVPPWFLL